MNIKLGNMAFKVNYHVKITGYGYRQVRLKNYVGKFENKTNNETRTSDDYEMNKLHQYLANEAGVPMDNHQAFKIGTLWLQFSDEYVYIATDAEIGFIGQY